MKDVIVYCQDTGALVAEVREKYPERLHDQLPGATARELWAQQDAQTRAAIEPIEQEREVGLAALTAEREDVLRQFGADVSYNGRLALGVHMAHIETRVREVKTSSETRRNAALSAISGKYGALYDEAMAEHFAAGTLDSKFILDKTATVRNGDETLALVRCRDGDKGEPPTEAMLDSLDSVQVLGTWEEVQADPKARAIYDRVYPRTPVKWTDEGGVEHTSTPPAEIGRFA